MRKLLFLVLVITMFLLVSCGGSDKKNEESAKTENKVQVTLKVYDRYYKGEDVFAGQKEIKAATKVMDAKESESIIKIVDAIDNWENNTLIDRSYANVEAEIKIDGREDSYYLCFYGNKIMCKEKEARMNDEQSGALEDLCKKYKYDDSLDYSGTLTLYADSYNGDKPEVEKIIEFDSKKGLEIKKSLDKQKWEDEAQIKRFDSVLFDFEIQFKNCEDIYKFGFDNRIASHVIPGVGTYSAGAPDEVYALCPER